MTGTERTMFFTTGKHQFYDHLMQQAPNFDKAPREIKDDSCLVCEGYNPKTGKCRFCVCLDEQQLPVSDREHFYKRKDKEK